MTIRLDLDPDRGKFMADQAMGHFTRHLRFGHSRLQATSCRLNCVDNSATDDPQLLRLKITEIAPEVGELEREPERRHDERQRDRR